MQNGFRSGCLLSPSSPICNLPRCVVGNTDEGFPAWSRGLTQKWQNQDFSCYLPIASSDCVCVIRIFYMMNSFLMDPVACRKKPVKERSYLKWFTFINKRAATTEALLDSYGLHLQTQPSLCRSHPSSASISSSFA